MRGFNRCLRCLSPGPAHMLFPLSEDEEDPSAPATGLSGPTQTEGDVVIEETTEYDQTTQADEETYLKDVFSANPLRQFLDNEISYRVSAMPGDGGYISTDTKLTGAAATLTLDSPELAPRRAPPEKKDALPNLQEHAEKQQELDKLRGKDGS